MVPLAAQSLPPNPTLPPNPNATPEVQRRQLELAAQALARLAVRPKVTCGMMVAPADPKVDPKLIKPVPDPTTKPTIRQVPPTVCR
jgi:hypothetical protein